MDLDVEALALRDALGARRLRVQVMAVLPDGLTQERALAAAWRAVRANHVLPGNSQDELLELRAVQPQDGGFLLQWRYVFDADFASQYDATESYALDVWVAGDRSTVRRFDRVR